jgi:hypothetical protein
LFTVPGAVFNAEPESINPAGAITGWYCAQGFHCHGFLRAPDGTITSFDPPGSTLTVATAINPSGVVTGLFNDVNGVQHGFVGTP